VVARMRSMVVASGVLLLVVGAVGAEAATTRTVVVTDNVFTPAAVSGAQGDSVKWVNQGNFSHTTTSTITGAVGWNSTLQPTGSFSKALAGAGTYAYHCNFHAGMSGKVKVRVSVTPASGPVDTKFTVKVASSAAPTGYAYAPQVKVPGSSSWTSLPTTTATSVSYVARSAGTYAFRSKVKHGSLAGTAPSPAFSVTVG